MPSQRQGKNGSSGSAMRLPPATDYLGQWLMILAEHYPVPEMTHMGSLGYRVGLEDLTPKELDLAFAETFKRHPKDFRPTSGEIRGYLREVRVERSNDELKALPEARITDEEAKEIWAKLRQQIGALPPSDLEVAQEAIKKAREEIKAIRAQPEAGCVIELSEEELTRRQQELKLKALDWWESQGESA